MDVAPEEAKEVSPPDPHWRGLISWLVFLSVNTIWRRMSIWREVKKREGMSVLDVGCGRHSPLAVIGRHYKFNIVGLDIFLPSLREAKTKGIYQDLVLGDATHLPFKDKSVQAVVCIGVIEHNEKEDAEKILNEFERVSSWLVLLHTAIGKYVHPAYEGNPYQAPGYFWSLKELKTRDFKVKGEGVKGLVGEHWDSLFPSFSKPLQYAIYIVGTLFSYFFPRIALHVVAWKERA